MIHGTRWWLVIVDEIFFFNVSTINAEEKENNLTYREDCIYCPFIYKNKEQKKIIKYYCTTCKISKYFYDFECEAE